MIEIDENDTNTVLKWVEQNQTSSPIPSHVAKVLPLVHPEKDLWGQHCYLQQSLVCDDYNNRQTDRHTHTHQFNGPLSGTTQVSRYQRGKTNLDFTEAKRRWVAVESAGLMQLCTYLQTDNNASTPPLSFLQAGYPSCHPTNCVKALNTYTHTRLKALCPGLPGWTGTRKVNQSGFYW